MTNLDWDLSPIPSPWAIPLELADGQTVLADKIVTDGLTLQYKTAAEESLQSVNWSEVVRIGDLRLPPPQQQE